jgi:hypothetical protein
LRCGFGTYFGRHALTRRRCYLRTECTEFDETLLAIGFVALLALVNFRGISESVRLNVVLTSIDSWSAESNSVIQATGAVGDTSPLFWHIGRVQKTNLADQGVYFRSVIHVRRLVTDPGHFILNPELVGAWRHPFGAVRHEVVTRPKVVPRPGLPETG